MSELSRQKLSFRPFLSLKALTETKAESRLAGLREQLAKLVTFLNETVWKPYFALSHYQNVKVKSVFRGLFEWNQFVDSNSQLFHPSFR